MRYLIMMLTVITVQSVALSDTQPFSQCPTKAFLVQDKVAKLYGVNLSTGYYASLAPHGWSASKLNALGFNYHDSYLYAYAYHYGTIVRIDSKYELTPLTLNGLPNIGFYVGDISVVENKYYLYRPGSQYGLYEIDLSEATLTANRIIDGSQLSLAIYDMAFHPDSNMAYAVDRWGNLLEINVATGSATKISNVGVSGVFGAAYFDVTGKLYISRNSDGKVYQIDLSFVYPKAELFAYGPASSNNDGARCALAPIIEMDSPTTDFGDAPDTYGTSIDKNGARHEITDNGIKLGSAVIPEPNAYTSTGEGDSDNDGVIFLSALNVGEMAIVQVTMAEHANLFAWIDWDRDGQFESDENIVSNYRLDSGEHVVSFQVPAWASNGKTWARFRVSSESDLLPIGGVSDGEVEDYAISVSNQYVSTQYYPSEFGRATLAFEDNWPHVGDYDFNDLVIYYQMSKTLSRNKVIGFTINGAVQAVGASHKNGFAFRVPGISPDDVDPARLKLDINGQEVQQFIEPNANELILRIAENIYDYITPGEGCKFYRTEEGCDANIQLSFSLEVPLLQAFDAEQFAAFPFDPFLFSTSGYVRSYVFGEAPGHRYEIHLRNQAPTEFFSSSFFKRAEDDSEPSEQRYFVNANGMPWAINIPYEWRYPLEYIDIGDAYPEFIPFMQFNDLEKKTWYLQDKSINNLIFK